MSSLSTSASARTTAVAGFTLIELLVVIGIVALLAGVVGVGLSTGNQAAAAAAGRGLLRAQLGAARSQAALNQGTTALVVADDETDTDRFRRFLAVAVATVGPNADGSGTVTSWRATTDGVLLPAGLQVVAPGDTETGSSLFSADSLAVALDEGSVTTACWAVQFDAQGNLVVAGGGRILLEAADGATGASALGGIVVSRYGAVSDYVAPVATEAGP